MTIYKACLLPVFVSLLWGSGCDSSSSTHVGMPARDGAGKPIRYYTECDSDADCPIGTCLRWQLEHDPGFPSGYTQCAIDCTSDADCPDTTDTGLLSPASCMSVQGGPKRCILSCNVDGLGYFECNSHRPTSCFELDDTHCSACGCPDGLRCSPAGCIQKAAVGEACSTDEDCQSSNCSATAHICRIALGSRCTSANCDKCLAVDPNLATSDWSYCSRGCLDNSACNKTTLCLPDRFTGQPGFCAPRCSAPTDPAACPTLCAAVGDQVSNTVVTYCPCSVCTGR